MCVCVCEEDDDDDDDDASALLNLNLVDYKIRSVCTRFGSSIWMEHK